MRDVADAHAGHADGLALARRDGLRGGELGLELERRVLDAREAQALVGEHVAADGQRDRPRAPTIAAKSRRCLRIARLDFVELLQLGGDVGDLEVEALLP